MKLCKDINIYKASSIEYLSSRILKDAFLAIPTIITKLMNISLSQGIFPDSWKMAKIVPLFKGGEKIDVNNYRPVSLLPLPGKLLEKIVHSRIMAFLNSHVILNDDQDGFRPGHATMSTVAKLTDEREVPVSRRSQWPLMAAPISLIKTRIIGSISTLNLNTGVDVVMSSKSLLGLESRSSFARTHPLSPP